jgi:hypothetical protein
MEILGIKQFSKDLKNLLKTISEWALNSLVHKINKTPVPWLFSARRGE